MIERTEPTRISPAGLVDGAVRIAPVAIFVVPFGLAFGAAATQVGLGAGQATLMSAVVWAGASQFAALDFWTHPLTLLPLLLAVFAVNARHLLLGAALYPWMRPLPAWQRYASAALISDANWAMAMAAFEKGERDLGLLVGSGLMMWLAWVGGTALGAGLGAALATPERFGLDALMLTFFACVLVDMGRREDIARPWSAAALAALTAVWLLPPNWHILAGGIAGGLAGAFAHDR